MIIGLPAGNLHMKKILLRVVLGVVALGVIALIVTAMFLGSIIKKGVETIGPRLTKTDVKLSSASVSVLSGSGSIKGFVLGNPQGYKGDYAIKVARVDLGLKPASLLSDKLHITEVRVESPEIAFEGNVLSPTKNSNLGKIMENVQSAAGGQTAPSQPTGSGKEASKKLQVDDLLVTGGKIQVTSVLSGGQPVTLPLPEIHLTNLGQGPDGITAAEVTKQVLDKVLQDAMTEILKSGANLGKNATEAASGALQGATGGVNKVLKGVGDLLKK